MHSFQLFCSLTPSMDYLISFIMCQFSAMFMICCIYEINSLSEKQHSSVFREKWQLQHAHTQKTGIGKKTRTFNVLDIVRYICMCLCAREWERGGDGGELTCAFNRYGSMHDLIGFMVKTKTKLLNVLYTTNIDGNLISQTKWACYPLC